MKLFYFTPMRHKLLSDFQVKIAYLYRKHLKRVAEKKRIEEEKRKKKLAAAAKKKGGKGKGKKGKKKKAATLTPKQGKDITTVGKDEKNLTELEPGVDQPTVDINVDGEPLEKDDEDDEKPGSQGSKRSKGTAENRSDLNENDPDLTKTVQLDEDGNPIEGQIVEKDSDDGGDKENRESIDLDRDLDATIGKDDDTEA